VSAKRGQAAQRRHKRRAGRRQFGPITIGGPKAGGCLPIFLVTMLLMITSAPAYWTGVLYLGDSGTGVPASRPVLFVVVGVINLICAIGIWHWRRWGLVGFVVTPLSLFLLNARGTMNFVLVIYAVVGPAMYSFFKCCRTGDRGLVGDGWYGGGGLGGGGFSRGGGGGFSAGGGGFGGGGVSGSW